MMKKLMLILIVDYVNVIQFGQIRDLGKGNLYKDIGKENLNTIINIRKFYKINYFCLPLALM